MQACTRQLLLPAKLEVRMFSASTDTSTKSASTTALSAPEVAKLAQTGAVKFTTSSVNLQQGSTLANGLVGHWTFDGQDTNWTSANTGVAYDRSGSNNTGTLTDMNRRTSVDGKLGQALNLIDSDDQVDVGTSATISPSIRTIAAWIYPRSLGGLNFGTVIESYNGGGIPWYLQLCSGDGTECPFTANTFVYLHNDEWAAPENTIKFNEWQHIAIVFDCSVDTNNPTFYYNGASVAATETRTDAVSMVCGDKNTKCIGGEPGGANFDGKIDDVRIYNRTPPAEVQQLYQLGSVRITQ